MIVRISHLWRQKDPNNRPTKLSLYKEMVKSK